jgi:hypothetical protein
MGQRRRGRDVAKEAAWRRVVGAQAASGLSVRAFCRERRLAESAFYFWRRELQARDAAVRAAPAGPAQRPIGKAPALRRTPRAVSSQRAPAAFAELTVVERPAAAPRGAIEIVLADDLRIAVHAGFSRETLQAVLAALKFAEPNAGGTAERPRC